jgi:putative tricarboxylic transport membrane protein
MDLFAQLAAGFAVSLTPINLLTCLIGVVLGTAVGVLPGLGPTATISLLLPITFRMDATASIIMVSGIYYGAMYGGSITSILVRIPGEAASMVTCIDGYQMARRGRAGAALGIAAFGSFIAGVAATLGIALVGPLLARVALAFGPAEYAALVLLGLILVTSVSDAPFMRSMIMVGLGLLAAAIGLDPITSSERFTAGNPYLQDGLGVAVLAMGLFGIAEVLTLAERRSVAGQGAHEPKRWVELLPTRTDWRESAAPITRGSVLGFALGLLPGGGALVASFASYVVEKRLARDPSRFGHGAIAGVAGPEAANNAAAQASFVPLLALGIPANVVMAVILGALMIHGIAPGPKLAQMQPQLFWGVIASMFVGNVMLVALNVPLVGLFVRLLRVPTHYLAPLIVLFCVVGAYSLRGSAVDVALMGIFGVLGWGARKIDLDPAPFLLAFVLGALFETSIRQALLIGIGNPAIFVTRPIAATLLALAALVLLWPIVRWSLRRRAGAPGS